MIKLVVTISDLSADLGEVYDAIDGGTTAATSMLVRARNFIDNISNGASTDDVVVRPLADAMCVNQVIGGVDSVNKTIGTLSVGSKDLNSMRGYFKEEAKRAAFVKGYSLDGLSIIFQDASQQ